MIDKTSRRGRHAKGLFLTLEGGEGAGKSSLQAFLAGRLQTQNYEVLATREPGGAKLGEFIRNWLLNRDFSIEVGARAELLLFLAARAQHIEELILPALGQGKIVICDRFNDSTIAYQGSGRGLGFDFVRRLCRFSCGEVEPDLTLFLDVDPKIGLARTKQMDKDFSPEGGLDRIEAEQAEFHAKAREGFHQIMTMEPKRVVAIDANAPQQEVFQTCWESVEKFLAV